MRRWERHSLVNTQNMFRVSYCITFCSILYMQCMPYFFFVLLSFLSFLYNNNHTSAFRIQHLMLLNAWCYLLLLKKNPHQKHWILNMLMISGFWASKPKKDNYAFYEFYEWNITAKKITVSSLRYFVRSSRLLEIIWNCGKKWRWNWL